MHPLICTILLFASPPGAQADASLPDALRPYADVAARCSRYHQLVSGIAWRTIYSENFPPGGSQTWECLKPPGANAPQTTAQREKLDGRVALIMKITVEQGLLRVGPKVSGEFAVEFLGRAIGDRPCDLSIFCDGIDRAPGFQFGAHHNTRNKLWLGPEKSAGADATPVERFVDLPADTLIVKDAWHRIRMELRNGQITASVDGKVLGSHPLTADYDRKALRQPLIYAYSSTIAIAEVRIESAIPGGPKLSEAEAWQQQFPNLTREDLDQKLRLLVELLADEDRATRTAAGALIRQTGPMIAPYLKAAAKSGTPEQQQRASDLLRSMGQ